MFCDLDFSFYWLQNLSVLHQTPIRFNPAVRDLTVTGPRNRSVPGHVQL